MSVRLPVKVVPGSSRNAIVGWLGDALKVRVTAAPEHGKANAAVAAILAERLGIAAGNVRVIAGHGSPRKVFEIAGLSESEIHRLLRKDAPLTS